MAGGLEGEQCGSEPRNEGIVRDLAEEPQEKKDASHAKQRIGQTVAGSAVMKQSVVQLEAKRADRAIKVISKGPIGEKPPEWRILGTNTQQDELSIRIEK